MAPGLLGVDLIGRVFLLILATTVYFGSHLVPHESPQPWRALIGNPISDKAIVLCGPCTSWVKAMRRERRAGEDPYRMMESCVFQPRPALPCLITSTRFSTIRAISNCGSRHFTMAMAACPSPMYSNRLRR